MHKREGPQDGQAGLPQGQDAESPEAAYRAAVIRGCRCGRWAGLGRGALVGTVLVVAAGVLLRRQGG